MSCPVESHLIDFIHTVTTDTAIATSTDLVISNVLDSLLLMDLVIVIENEFGVRLEGDDIAPENFRTIENLAGMVNGKISFGGPNRRVAA